MNKDIQAKEGQARAVAVFEKRPSQALNTSAGTATVNDGFACTFSDGAHTVSVDMPEAIGGTDTGPSPGYYGRAGICSCIAVGIKMAATREGVTLSSVAVSIEQDFDNRGILGFADIPAVPSDTRIRIDIASTENPDIVDDLVQRTLRSDPWFLAYKNAQPVNVDLNTTAEPA